MQSYLYKSSAKFHDPILINYVILFLDNNYGILHLSADDIFSVPHADVWISVRLCIYVSILVFCKYYPIFLGFGSGVSQDCKTHHQVFGTSTVCTYQ